MYDLIDKKLSLKQAGFRRNSSTAQQINVLKGIIEGTESKQQKYVVSFIDFKKAFDSIDRKAMWKILRHYGVPIKIVNAIKCLYDNSKAKIRLGYFQMKLI